MPGLLIVDDEASARYALRRAFEAHYAVFDADSVEAARQRLGECDPDVILLDYTMPGEDGMVLLKELAERADSPPVIMLTAYGSERLAVQAMKSGAYDYLPKPFDLDELRLMVARAAEHRQLRREVRQLRERLSCGGQFGRMSGDSPAMRQVFETAARVAPSDLNILILGESGTGKDLLAQEIHARSLRAAHPLIALNCAALPETLVESELFGYEKGAFTGAFAARAGKFELAHKGTLFLDEIGDMQPSTQAKILRAAETGTVERLGGTRPIPADVRLIAATNQDLQEAVRSGRFRQDLYFRLAGIVLRLPPLRERREDIPLLVAQFWSDLQLKYRRQGPRLSSEVIRRLAARPWPGNVRQLRSAVERLFVLAPGDAVSEEDLRQIEEPALGSAGVAPCFQAEDYREARRLFETEYLTRKLREHGGNVTRTAAAIGLERQSLQEKIRQLGISREC